MDWENAAFIVDLLFWAHKAWHAVPATTRTPGGRAANMVHGFAAMLIKLLSDRAPRFLVTAADVGGSTWRHELFPTYKAAREPHPPGFDEQLVEVVRLLELHRVPVLGVPGFEADDVMATLVRRFRGVGVPVVIVTADKDLRQLVTDTAPAVLIWDGKDRFIGERTVAKEWGVGPERVGDFLALTGDDGDGIPGVPGIGPKRATELLHDAADLEQVLVQKQWTQNAVGRALRAGADQLRLSRRLVALRGDVPLEVELGACALGGYDVPGLRAFYEAAGLGRLAARMEEAPAKRLVGEALEAEWRRVICEG
jgi:DNA polymerase I